MPTLIRQMTSRLQTTYLISEQDGGVISVKSCVGWRGRVPGSNLGKTPIMLTGFSWSKPALQASAELLRLGHDHVIPNLLLLIIKRVVTFNTTQPDMLKAS